MAAVNTLTQPGGYVPDGASNTSESGGGTLEAAECAGSRAHRTAPHLEPAKK